MLEARGLTKYYGPIKAVEDLSFSIKKGEIVGLLGPNGAGKTTTLRLLSGFMPPTSGEVQIAGHDMMQSPRLAKRQLGYLPENNPLYPELTVRETLQFMAGLHGLPKGQRASSIDEAIERTHLVDVANRLIGNLSRGYQQRVGLAQVLVKRPQVLILDEPTVGLDPKQIAEVRSLIKDLSADYTVLLSSHILQEVSATCHRVIIIHRGHLVAQGTHEDLLERKGGPQVIRVVLKGPQVCEAEARVREIRGVESLEAISVNGEVHLKVLLAKDHDFQKELFHLSTQQNWVPYELTPERSSLEEIFLQLTEEGS